MGRLKNGWPEMETAFVHHTFFYVTLATCFWTEKYARSTHPRDLI